MAGKVWVPILALSLSKLRSWTSHFLVETFPFQKMRTLPITQGSEELRKNARNSAWITVGAH